jgi:peptide/nickel transport system substrate-binding protein
MPLNLRRPALQDTRVRQAIDLALDRREIVERAIPGAGAPAYQPVPPSSWAFVPSMDRSYRDVEKAKRLLDDAGWRGVEGSIRRREGRPLVLQLIVWKDEIFRRTAAQVIREQLGRVGVDVQMHLVDNAAYNRLAENMGDTYDGFIGGWGSLLDPGDNLFKKFHSKGSQNAMGYSDNLVDMMLTEARAVADPLTASPLYRRVMEKLRDQAVFLPLAYPDYLFAVGARVSGIEPAVVDSWYEFPKHAHRWSLTPAKRE